MESIRGRNYPVDQTKAKRLVINRALYDGSGAILPPQKSEKLSGGLFSRTWSEKKKGSWARRESTAKPDGEVGNVHFFGSATL